MIKHPPEEAVAVVGSLIIVLGVNALLIVGQGFKHELQ